MTQFTKVGPRIALGRDRLTHSQAAALKACASVEPSPIPTALHQVVVASLEVKGLVRIRFFARDAAVPKTSNCVGAGTWHLTKRGVRVGIAHGFWAGGDLM